MPIMITIVNINLYRVDIFFLIFSIKAFHTKLFNSLDAFLLFVYSCTSDIYFIRFKINFN